MGDKLILLDSGNGSKLHVPATGVRKVLEGETPVCNPWRVLPFNTRVQFEDEVEREDICKRCLQASEKETK